MMTEYVNPLKRSLTVRFSQLMPKMPSPMRQKSKKSPKTKEIEEEKQEKPHLDNAQNNIQQRISNFLLWQLAYAEL